MSAINPLLKTRVLKKRIDSFYQELKDRGDHTWDFKDLKTDYSDVYPVLIYDAMMKGHEDSGYLKDSLFFGPATTLEDDFFLTKCKGDAICMFPSEPDIKKGEKLDAPEFKRVQGELYGVDLGTLTYLDKAFQNGFAFNRVSLPVQLHTSKSQAVVVRRVFCYVANYGYWKDHKDNRPMMIAQYGKVSNYRQERVYRAYHHEYFEHTVGMSPADMFEEGYY